MRGAAPAPPPLGPPLAGAVARRLPLPPQPRLVQPDARWLLPGADGPSTLAASASTTDSSMSSDFPHYNFRMPNIGFQNLPLNIYIVVFGTAIFVFILSLLFCCYLIRLRHQAHKEFYAYKQVILKEKVKELNLHELCAVCLEDFKPRDELGICPCKHAFHRKCLIKWLEVRKVCPLCNMPVLQLAQLHSKQDRGPLQGPLPGAENIV
ncbi:RING finger protein 24 isoform X1 [Bos javanicus]|uniref:Ring finger protein 24 n=1 Tax=Bos taurus TaxID=9913 RepID=A0ABI0P4M5_BOVIN|nr:RING finger protein 24 isoform X1 [Bos javanicus]